MRSMTARMRRPGRYQPPRHARLFWRPPHGQNDTVCTCICSFKFMFLRLFYQLRLRLHDRAQEDGPALTLTNCAETPMPVATDPARYEWTPASQTRWAVTWRPEHPDGSRPHSRRHITRQQTQTLFPELPSTCTVRPPQRWFRAAPGAAGNPAPRGQRPSRSAELI